MRDCYNRATQEILCSPINQEVRCDFYAMRERLVLHLDSTKEAVQAKSSQRFTVTWTHLPFKESQVRGDRIPLIKNTCGQVKQVSLTRYDPHLFIVFLKERREYRRMDLSALNILRGYSSFHVGCPSLGGWARRVTGVELVITSLMRVRVFGSLAAAGGVLIALRNPLLIFIRFSKQVIFHGRR